MEIFSGGWVLGVFPLPPSPPPFFFSPRISYEAKYFGIVKTEEKGGCLTVYEKPISPVSHASASRNGIIAGWGYLLTTFEGDL